MASAHHHHQQPLLHSPLLHSPDAEGQDVERCHHVHYSGRGGWLRAFVLGANDGLISVAALMLGVGAGSDQLHTMQLSGIAALVAGACSMACGEYISVASQKDAEEADIEKERLEQMKGPEARERELEELTQIYINRGLNAVLARQVAIELSAQDAVRAHARDELGIYVDDLANPLQATLASAAAFLAGGCVPLLAGAFITDVQTRIIAVAGSATIALLVLGALGSWLGGASLLKGPGRVLVGGLLAMAITYGVGTAFNVSL